MCGQGTIERIQKNWSMYAPKILAMEQQDESSELVNENRHQKALEILDQKLRSGGAAHKVPAVFAIHEVCDAFTCIHIHRYIVATLLGHEGAKASKGVEISCHFMQGFSHLF